MKQVISIQAVVKGRLMRKRYAKLKQRKDKVANMVRRKLFILFVAGVLRKVDMVSKI